jgi:hypothetical protein
MLKSLNLLYVYYARLLSKTVAQPKNTTFKLSLSLTYLI